MADALIFAWYPGEQGGLAVSNAIFGKSVPSGKLPVTFPMSVDDLPPYEDYAMANRTYRYMKKPPLFPFGFGLSYTTFSYGSLSLSKPSIGASESITATTTVTNTGKYAGEEVVQLYVTDLVASVEVPRYTLKGFQRVALEPGESKIVTFEVTPKMLEIVNEDGESILESGEFQISVGGSVPSNRSRSLGAPAYQQANLMVK